MRFDKKELDASTRRTSRAAYASGVLLELPRELKTLCEPSKEEEKVGDRVWVSDVIHKITIYLEYGETDDSLKKDFEQLLKKMQAEVWDVLIGKMSVLSAKHSKELIIFAKKILAKIEPKAESKS